MRQGIPLRSAGGDWLRQRLDAGAAVRAAQGLSTWLRGSRLGLVVMALAVGVGAGFGAVGFRWLIFAFTWLATGYQQFGQQGRVASLHLPWLGIWFLLLVPVLGGLIYGPLIQRFAREARGHGVPEVMLAVAENGGRIRPQVTVVKAVASAICIGVGGSVGREGPIVQIGSAFASTLGQLVRMSETRLRIIVACGAAGGIAATFNAPITGVFFGFEIVLREFSLDAIFATILAAVSADLVSQAFFGSGPFFAQIPHDLTVVHPATYLLVALLGLAAGLLGYGFKTVLYKFEDVADTLWRGRPEWARPAVGGVALGLLLLALPQLYGVGYPVMNQAVAGNIVLWLLVVLIVGKIVAASLTLSIGGSGGVFAPSLFTGAMAGMAFGVIVEHLFGPVVSSPAIFGVVAMGAVFGAAAQAPLTAIASVVEMTGNFTLTLPGDAGGGDRLRSFQATRPRQHLHHQAAPPGHRHRASEADERAANAHRCRRHAAGRPGGRNGTPARGRRQGTPAGTQHSQALGGDDGIGDRHAPDPGAARRRDPGTGAPPADPVRPDRAPGALAGSPAPDGLDHPARGPSDHD